MNSLFLCVFFDKIDCLCTKKIENDFFPVLFLSMLDVVVLHLLFVFLQIPSFKLPKDVTKGVAPKISNASPIPGKIIPAKIFPA